MRCSTAWRPTSCSARPTSPARHDAVVGTDHYRIAAFVGFVDPRSVVRLNREHSAFRWTTFEEAVELLPIPSQRELLRRVRERFVDASPPEVLRILTRTRS